MLLYAIQLILQLFIAALKMNTEIHTPKIGGCTPKIRGRTP